MLKRIITGVVLVLILIPVLLLSDTLFFIVLLAAVTVIGVFEMLRCMGLHKNIVFSVPVYLLAAASPFAARYLSADRYYDMVFPFMMLCVVFMFAAYTFSGGKVTLEQTGGAIAGCIYIIASFTAIVLLRDIPVWGRYIYLFVFIGAWTTDIFAYFTGVAFGKHKLIPQISPNKTVEGAVGGILFCVVGFWLYGAILHRVMPEVVPNYPVFIIGGLLTSLTAQAGDLIMSAIKRARGIKDFGRIFPGHGGVLDRFDSVMPVAIALLTVESFFDLFM